MEASGGESGNVERQGKAMAKYPYEMPRMQRARAIPVAGALVPAKTIPRAEY
jgi:hypothetical protein